MKIKEKRFFELIGEYLTVFLPVAEVLKLTYNKILQRNTERIFNLSLFIPTETVKKISRFPVLHQIPSMPFSNGLRWNAAAKTSTLNHHLSVIRAFLKYASIREPVYNDCYLSAGQVVRRKEETKYIVKHFNDDALRAMLFQPNPAIKNEHRDQFYMILLYDTGARNSELLNLRLQDVVIDTSTPYIIIRGKGKKDPFCSNHDGNSSAF